MSISSFVFPEIGQEVTSTYNEVGQLDPSVLETLAAHHPDKAWAMCDAFSTTESGILLPNQEVLKYQQQMGWEPLPGEEDFQAAYRQVRDRIISDASVELDSKALALMIQIKHSGLKPGPLDDYDNVPHLDFVSLNGQKVLIYYLSSKSPTKIFTGKFTFQGFLDDYSQHPDFAHLKEEQPRDNQLVRALGITCLHAPATPSPGRIFIRAFVEAKN